MTLLLDYSFCTKSFLEAGISSSPCYFTSSSPSSISFCYPLRGVSLRLSSGFSSGDYTGGY